MMKRDKMMMMKSDKMWLDISRCHPTPQPITHVIHLSVFIIISRFIFHMLRYRITSWEVRTYTYTCMCPTLVSFHHHLSFHMLRRRITSWEVRTYIYTCVCPTLASFLVSYVEVSNHISRSMYVDIHTCVSYICQFSSSSLVPLRLYGVRFLSGLDSTQEKREEQVRGGILL